MAMQTPNLNELRKNFIDYPWAKSVRCKAYVHFQ